MAKRKKEKNSAKYKKGRKLPSTRQWKQFFKLLNKTEKKVFSLLASLAFISLITLTVTLFITNTEVMADHGGTLREGIVGQPRFINPLYLAGQDTDRDIVEVLFSGLMKYDQKGGIVNDLTESYEIKDQGRIVELTLKPDLYWHDKEPLTADDVVFTINLVQEPQAQSPLRIKWMGIVVEKMASHQIRFRLPKKYAGFIENLTLKILPKHILDDIAPADLAWELMSQKRLIGSGPFQFKKINQNKNGGIGEIILEKNNLYYGNKPFLNELHFVFYNSTKDLIKGARTGEIDSFALSDTKYFSEVENVFDYTQIKVPRYFSLFFNLEQDNIFKEKNIREVLAYGINYDQIINQVFLGKSQKAISPILPEFFNFNPPNAIYSFNKEKAETLLDEAGYLINPETGIREKQITGQTSFSFTRNLTLNSQSDDVQKLQECLKEYPAIYPEGIVSGYFGTKTKQAVIRFQEKYADDILHPVGLTSGNGEVKPMTRQKLNEVCFNRPDETKVLKITLTTSNRFPLTEIAEILKENWQNIGAEVIIQKISSSDLQTSTLSKRNFTVLLFGEALGAIPDPFPFWHSSQVEYPGLNITGYSSKTADNLLEEARETNDETSRQINLEEFQNLLIKFLPAIFLVSPDYIYITSPKVNGFNMKKITEPAKRFSEIEKIYVKTKRIWVQGN